VRRGRSLPLSVDLDASAACPAGDPQAQRELLRLQAVSAGTAAPRMAAPRSGEYPATTAAAAPDSLANSRRENLVLMCGVHDSRRQRAASSDAKNEAASEL